MYDKENFKNLIEVMDINIICLFEEGFLYLVVSLFLIREDEFWIKMVLLGLLKDEIKKYEEELKKGSVIVVVVIGERKDV